MQPPVVTTSRPRSVPSFSVMARQPMRPSAVLLAVMIAGGVLSMVGMGLGHGRAKHFRDDEGGSAARTTGGAPSSAAHADDDEDDDPSQVDTIVLGDAGDAPVPARKGRISNVHATLIVHLPRFGEQAGLIPDSAAGHLLYRWLAAFNQANDSALEDALPNNAEGATAEAQMELRRQTGGFNLLSAKEVQPGLIVFRLRDQTPEA
ncbi:hypothetical protein [Terriglobus sp. RCC_193]|uniref:hypothetical protein n=1 Tax=Terriglobus sp. RCC_193 TaxID=3239218 RepID=UPI0035234B38